MINNYYDIYKFYNSLLYTEINIYKSLQINDLQTRPPRARKSLIDSDL